MSDIGSVEEHGWTFILDKQKGLVETFEELLPYVDHRYCLKHMYNNFKAKFKGNELKDALWKAASARTVKEFKWQMRLIKEINLEKHEAYN